MKVPREKSRIQGEAVLVFRPFFFVLFLFVSSPRLFFTAEAAIFAVRKAAVAAAVRGRRRAAVVDPYAAVA